MGSQRLEYFPWIPINPFAYGYQSVPVSLPEPRIVEGGERVPTDAVLESAWVESEGFRLGDVPSLSPLVHDPGLSAFLDPRGRP